MTLLDRVQNHKYSSQPDKRKDVESIHTLVFGIVCKCSYSRCHLNGLTAIETIDSLYGFLNKSCCDVMKEISQ